jgi:hypothetical protein
MAKPDRHRQSGVNPSELGPAQPRQVDQPQAKQVPGAAPERQAPAGGKTAPKPKSKSR